MQDTLKNALTLCGIDIDKVFVYEYCHKTKSVKRIRSFDIDMSEEKFMIAALQKLDDYEVRISAMHLPRPDSFPTIWYL